jgi:hypothetical protein
MLTTIASLMLTVFAPVTEKSLDEKRQDPVLAIQEAYRMAEAKDWKTLIKTFAPPDEKLKMTDKDIEEFIKMMETDEGKKMIEELKACKDAKPTMSEKDTRASFDAKVGDKPVSVKLIKIEKYWYLK